MRRGAMLVALACRGRREDGARLWGAGLAWRVAAWTARRAEVRTLALRP